MRRFFGRIAKGALWIAGMLAALPALADRSDQQDLNAPSAPAPSTALGQAVPNLRSVGVHQLALRMVDHCMKDPDPTGLFSKSFYGACNQKLLDRIAGFIAQELARNDVQTVNVSGDPDAIMSVDLTLYRVKTNPISDFLPSKLEIEANVLITDAANNTLWSGRVVLHEGGNGGATSEHRFASQVAATLANVGGGGLGAGGAASTGGAALRGGTPLQIAEASAVIGVIAKAYRSLAVKPLLPDAVRIQKHLAEVAEANNRLGDAMKAYQSALSSANWWPEGYREYALLLGKTNQPGLALINMGYYLQFIPDAPDRDAMKSKIAEWAALAHPDPVPTSFALPPGSKGKMGAILFDLPTIVAASIGQPDLEGAAVALVFTGSPAAAADLRSGDIITSCNGTRVVRFIELVNLIQATPQSTPLSLHVLRDGKPLDITVVR